MTPRRNVKPAPEVPAPVTGQLRLKWRVLLSILLLLHVLAVFMGPFTFATSSGPGLSSPFAEPIHKLLRPYLDLAFLDHGYFFFAPNPGPSHLLRAKLEFDDGRPPQEIILPDRQRQWSRLRYHRQFMLAEQFHADFVPPEPVPEIAGDPEQLKGWQRARKVFELREKSLVDHLRHEYGASKATLTRLEHALLWPDEFLRLQRQLDAPSTYIDLPSDAVASLPPGTGVRP